MSESPRRSGTTRRLLSLSVAAFLLAALVAPLTIQAAPQAPGSADQASSAKGQDAWQRIKGKPAKTHNGRPAALKTDKLATWTLNKGQLAKLLKTAPRESSKAAKDRPLVVDLPSPTGGFQRFELTDAPIVEAGLAAKHPDIRTFRGRGVDDPTATIRADITKLGFHASIRSKAGSWYIDPYYHLDQSLYASYFGRDLKGDGVPFVERDAGNAQLAVDEGYYHAADTVQLTGTGFAEDSEITITISDPEAKFATRTLSASTGGGGNFSTSFVADPDGNLDTHVVEATDGESWGLTGYQVVRDDDPTVDPPTGDVLREYRLALITDPGYATYHGGSANVTAAKVTLMNRVVQIYEDDLSIRMVLIANNDLLNLDTWDVAIGPNGACGVAGCFSQTQLTACQTTRARIVIGQIIGASQYDIGHLALGQPGGGVASFGVGRGNKANGCTGIPTPIGDFYAVDYVAHEMGHQFFGNHTFNGNQLNCSGGNRNASTSVEPGSGSSIMAYAGICTADDLQPHSDPYFSQRSLQEISTYTSSDSTPINEVQTVSLRHFGGGNEVQAVTFGPGYQQAAAIQPLTVAIGAAPSATQLGGLDQTGNTVTVSTGAAGATHTLQPGDSITISGAGNAGYNGTWTVDAVLTSRAFTYTNPTSGLPRSGGGTITLNNPGLSQIGNTVTVRTTLANNRAVGDIVVITGAGVAAYNGTWTVTSVLGPRAFTFEHTSAGLANSGLGTVTYSSPFKVRIGGADSAVIGGTSQAYNNANIGAAINAIPGFGGTVTAAGAGIAGFTLAFSGASAGIDVANVELVDLSCGGCYASVEETNHGGAFDSFTLNYNGAVSAPIVNGTNYNGAGLAAAMTSILPPGATATLAAFGGGGIGTLNNQGFQVTYTGTLALTNVSVTLQAQDFTAGASGFTGETDKGGAVDNKGGSVTPTGNTWPTVTVPGEMTIPLRTPFALTGSATDAEEDAMVFSWEQNDRGAAAGTSLLNNTKLNGPLFAMFPVSGQISATDTLLYHSPGENLLGSDPTRTFPALYKIIDGNTNAETGACPAGPIAPPVPIDIRECFMEFLPTSDYVGFAGVNASPLSLNFRFTARDLEGGVNAADTRLLLATNAGPFLVNGPGGGAEWTAGSTRTVSWDVANTDIAPVSAANVKISLSLDGGWTYPVVLAESTANDGAADVIVPNVVSETARLKVEAVGNVFFDISNADFTVSMPGVIGLDSVFLGGKNTLVDSFDSDAGAYGPANRSSTADLFSNGGVTVGAARVAGDIRSATGGVTIDKDGRVTGNVRAGTTIVNLGTIGGTATPNSPSPTIAAPAVAACSPFSGSGGLSGKFTYSPATGNLSVSGGKTVTLANGSYCFNNVTLSGGSTLAVGGPVTISIRGVLNASGGSFLNRTLAPANLQISSSYAGANGVTISGGSSGAYLSLYAPQTNVTLSGSGAIYGAVLGKSLAVSGGGAVHYDVQLVTVWAEYFNP